MNKKLKLRLLSKRFKKRVRKKIRTFIKMKKFLYKGTVIINSLTGEHAGYVDEIYDEHEGQVEVDIILNTKTAMMVKIGSVPIVFVAIKSSFMVEDKQGYPLWKKLQRQYKEVYKEQQRTIKLRKQGKIGKDYFEEW